MAAGGTVLAGALADQGKIRESNEDRSFYCRFDVPRGIGGGFGVLAAVADGMGGHAAGEAASERAIQVIQSRFFELDESQIGEGNPDDWVSFMIDSVKGANREVYEEAGRWQGRTGMGTTLTAAAIIGEYLYVGHVGDSRAYIIRHGSIKQVTEDDTWTAEQVRRGRMSESEARESDKAGQLLRALGIKPDVEVSGRYLKLVPGDVILLCTDGLTGVVSDEEIRRSLRNIHSPQQTCERLIKFANKRGGPDNVAVLVLAYKPEQVRKPKSLSRKSTRRAMVAGLIAVLILLAADAVYIASRYSEVPKPIRSVGKANKPQPPVSVTLKEKPSETKVVKPDNNPQPEEPSGLIMRDLSGDIIKLPNGGE